MSEPHAANTPVLQYIVTTDAPSGDAIDWHQSAGEIQAFVGAIDRRRQMRGQHQQPVVPASAAIHHRVIEICECRAGGTMSSYPVGTITRCDDELWVQTGRGHLAIDRILVEGREEDAAGFFVAAGFTPGDTFDTSHRWTSPTSPTSPSTPRPYRHAA
jgi:methionyl-tRNA formyltransferase